MTRPSRGGAARSGNDGNPQRGGAFHPWKRPREAVRSLEESRMDKDRVEGVGKQIKGAVKDMAGKVTGDSKMQAEGKADKAEGKVQNTVGGAKDGVRDAVNKS